LYTYRYVGTYERTTDFRTPDIFSTDFSASHVFTADFRPAYIGSSTHANTRYELRLRYNLRRSIMFCRRFEQDDVRLRILL
jgi:hypothetical protein